jgi:hypothetical protein
VTAGLLVYRELDDMLQLTDTAADMLAATRTDKKARQSMFGRLADYDGLQRLSSFQISERHR